MNVNISEVPDPPAEGRLIRGSYCEEPIAGTTLFPHIQKDQTISRRSLDFLRRYFPLTGEITGMTGDGN